jgi:hypothetical protein
MKLANDPSVKAFISGKEFTTLPSEDSNIPKSVSLGVAYDDTNLDFHENDLRKYKSFLPLEAEHLLELPTEISVGNEGMFETMMYNGKA